MFFSVSKTFAVNYGRCICHILQCPSVPDLWDFAFLNGHVLLVGHVVAFATAQDSQCLASLAYFAYLCMIRVDLPWLHWKKAILVKKTDETMLCFWGSPLQFTSCRPSLQYWAAHLKLCWALFIHLQIQLFGYVTYFLLVSQLLLKTKAGEPSFARMAQFLTLGHSMQIGVNTWQQSREEKHRKTRNEHWFILIHFDSFHVGQAGCPDPSGSLRWGPSRHFDLGNAALSAMVPESQVPLFVCCDEEFWETPHSARRTVAVQDVAIALRPVRPQSHSTMLRDLVAEDKNLQKQAHGFARQITTVFQAA